ncbi:Eco57I restriction-modification methylase domain-containing protein [Exiguobacterium sp. TRN 1102]|uniref:Eco57I restriction-modification methylase domain-containing protein n=1 Tax=Exiguobacterium sp. TRN 1102 TaxID=3420732 RepID=UPI003D785463
MKEQVFTPLNVVEKMLEIADYNKNLFGKKVLEDSFGIGNILIPVITRYIENGIEEGISLSEIQYGLENDIYGAEIDTFLYEKCIERLNHLTKKYGIKNVNWQLENKDSLTIDWEVKFDFIFGNPPYIKYHELPIDKRIWLRKNYESCKLGNFDYYYAFTENAVNSLSDKGNLVYLIPNNVFKNVYGFKLREILNKDIDKVYFYNNELIFENALVTSCIINVVKNKCSPALEYQIHNEGLKKCINKNQLGLDKWVFDENFIRDEKMKIFSDLFLASMPVATLYNKAFILRNVEFEQNKIFYQGMELEKEIVRKAASPKSISLNREEYIIFPYKIENKCLFRYGEVEFQDKFPNVSKHLKKFLKDLENRRVSSGVNWFEYGRTQAIKNQNKSKLLISTIVTNKVNVYYLDNETIAYSGIYITAIGETDLKFAEEVLTSSYFMDYIKQVGTRTTPNSIRITAKDINNFPLHEFI